MQNKLSTCILQIFYQWKKKYLKKSLSCKHIKFETFHFFFTFRVIKIFLIGDGCRQRSPVAFVPAAAVPLPVRDLHEGEN
jgi:hypothetical protein